MGFLVKITKQDFVHMCEDYWYRRNRARYGDPDENGNYDDRNRKELPENFRLYNGIVAQIAEKHGIEIKEIYVKDSVMVVVEGKDGKFYHFGSSRLWLEIMFDWVHYTDDAWLSAVTDLAEHKANGVEWPVEVTVWE